MFFIFYLLSLGTISAMAITAGFISLAFWVVQIIAGWFVFEKAGIAGWKSIIPIYSDYIFFRLCWETKYFWIMLATEIVYEVINYITSYSNISQTANVILNVVYVLLVLFAVFIQFVFCRRLALSFGRGTGFGVGLFFLYHIFILILAFGRARYVGKQYQKSY